MASMLWPDELDEAARSNLRRHLHRLTHSLPKSAVPWVLTKSASLQWNSSAAVFVDTRRFVEASADPCCRGEAIELYTGEFLSGYDDDWTIAERERYRALYIDVCRDAAIDSRQQRRFSEASGYVNRMLAVDEFREDAIRLAMSIRYESGDRTSALSLFTTFASRLWSEMGVEPMPETLALRNTILANEPLASQLSLSPRESNFERHPGQLPFVGRGREIDQLRRAWQRAARGSGATVFVSGEAGIGKSRLAAEFGMEVESQGGLVLVGITSNPETQPYQALLDALRRALPLIAESDVGVVWLSVLGTLLPELSALVPSLPDPPPLPADQARVRLFESISRCLEAVARSRPLLVVLEDLHWAHAAGMDALMTIGQRVTVLPMLIVGTYRSEEAASGSPLRQVNRALQRDRRAASIALSPLKASDVSQMIASMPELRQAPEHFVEITQKYSEGNPLFVAQLLGAYTETSNYPDETSAVSSLHDAILSRIDALEPATRAIAEVSATIGSPFTSDMVASVGGWRPDEVLDGIGTLTERSLVRESGHGALDYAFSHALIENAIYETSPEAARQARHHRAARILEQDPTVPNERVALHWERAGVAERAAQAYLAAARAALAVFAREAAEEYLQRVVVLTSLDPVRFEALTLLVLTYEGSTRVKELESCVGEMELLAGLLSDEERFVAAKARQNLASLMGDQEAQGRAIEEMLRLARTLNDRRKLASAFDAAGFRSWTMGRSEEARAFLDRALREAHAVKDAELVSRIQVNFARALSAQGERDAAFAILEEARHDRSLQNASVQLPLLETEAYILTVILCSDFFMPFRMEDLERGKGVAEEMLHFSRETGSTDTEARARLLLGSVAFREYRYDVARAEYQFAIEIFDRVANNWWRNGSTYCLALLEYEIGHWARADELLVRTISGTRENGYSTGEAYSLLVRGYIAMDRGDVERASEFVEPALALAANFNVPKLLDILRLFRTAVQVRKGSKELPLAVRAPNLRSEDVCLLLDAYLRAGRNDVMRSVAGELRRIAHRGAHEVRHPVQVAVSLARVAHFEDDEPEARRWIEAGKRALEERLASFSKSEDREAYQKQPFVTALLDLAAALPLRPQSEPLTTDA
jgi:DNA-binding SARP family transcriptional activator